jgi:type II secretory pathway pseudopilin PulG
VAKTKNNAFTIVELLVAMSLLVILLGLSGMVFKTTVSAHRAAGATIDVSRNLRAVTEQISTDLRGLRKDAPLALWFERDPATGRRYDQIQFFADGDFQTTKQYDDGTADTTVYGNMARIYYGHAWIADTAATAVIEDYYDVLNFDGTIDRGSLALVRRTHILTSNLNLTPHFVVPNFNTTFNPLDNDRYEYDLATLTDWNNLCQNTANCNHLIETCFGNYNDYALGGRPKIDYQDFETLHLLLSQGTIQMQIQFSYLDPATQQIRWFPGIDPAGDGSVASDFSGQSRFGYYYNMPVGVDPDMDGDGNPDTLWTFWPTLPKALKFTFVLRDSNGVFDDGKTFTHIVYLDN